MVQIKTLMLLSIKSILVLSLLVSISTAQIDVSEAFQKTLKKLAKERIKKEVIAWITEKDPITGIIGRDLIAQMLDGKDEQTLLRSTTNVVTTMIFLGGIKHHVEALVDSTSGVLEHAESAGWSRDQLVAYSCLYYYFSERLKNNLYVAPEILKMSEEKSRIEAFQSSQGRKWTVIVAGKLVGLRRAPTYDLSVDVRSLEVLDKSLWILLSNRDKFIQNPDSIFQSYIRAFESDRSFNEAVNAFIASSVIGKHLENLLELYITSYQQSYSVANTFDDKLRGLGSLPRIYNNLVAVASFDYIDQGQARSNILGVIRDLLEKWIEQSHKDGWKIDYVFSLAATGLRNSVDTSVDFTVLDQIRFVKFFEFSRFFVYSGGFFDPLFKSTINTGGKKIYLAGVGWGWHSTYIAVSAGITYPEIKLKNTNLAISFGYEIPIDELLE